jgi:hypothetical protein
MGVQMDFLEQRGLLETTLIVFTFPLPIWFAAPD